MSCSIKLCGLVFRAMALGTIALSASPTAASIDCELASCIDLSDLDGSSGVDWSTLINDANEFYETDTNVYLVSAFDEGISSPYFLPEQESVTKGQIHIPDIYHWVVSNGRADDAESIWKFIVGHEMAHAYQVRANLDKSLVGPFDSVVVLELHADYLAGFFLTKRYGLSVTELDSILNEVERLPTGEPGDPDFHGAHAQRVIMVTRGALFAVADPGADLKGASICGLEMALELIANTRSGC
ncbi:MAG: hypothetical protein AAFV37_03210 [Pseudomonadota bacterium]